jgi:hypothetical protein
MTLPQTVNSFGLAFDIIGALMIWKYGLPESISKEGHIYLIDEGIDEQEVAKAKKYERLSKVALTLLIIGFGLQLASNFLR